MSLNLFSLLLSSLLFVLYLYRECLLKIVSEVMVKCAVSGLLGKC